MKTCQRPQGTFDDSACSTTQNLICANTGDLAGYCTCASNQYFDKTQNKCLSMKIASKSCISSVECRQDLGLSCVNGICKCKTNYYWNDTSACSMIFL